MSLKPMAVRRVYPAANFRRGIAFKNRAEARKALHAMPSILCPSRQQTFRQTAALKPQLDPSTGQYAFANDMDTAQSPDGTRALTTDFDTQYVDGRGWSYAWAKDAAEQLFAYQCSEDGRVLSTLDLRMRPLAMGDEAPVILELDAVHVGETVRSPLYEARLAATLGGLHRGLTRFGVVMEIQADDIGFGGDHAFTINFSHLLSSLAMLRIGENRLFSTFLYSGIDVASAMMSGGSFMLAGTETVLPHNTVLIGEVGMRDGRNDSIYLLGLRPVRAVSRLDDTGTTLQWRQRGDTIDFPRSDQPDAYFPATDGVIEGIEIMLIARDRAVFSPQEIGMGHEISVAMYEALNTLFAERYKDH